MVALSVQRHPPSGELLETGQPETRAALALRAADLR
jgi:hypothetical protein